MPPFNRQNITINIDTLPAITPNVNDDTIIYDANQLASPIVITTAGTGLTLFNGSSGIDYAFNSLVAGSNVILSYSNGNIYIASTGNVLLQPEGGLEFLSGALGLNISNLNASGGITGTNLIAISQNGTTYQTTIQNAFNAITPIIITATQSTITADNIHSQFSVGSVLPSNLGSPTAVSRVIMNVGTVFAGGSTTQALVTDGSNILMQLSENDITTVGIYESQTSDTINSAGSQCLVQFYNSSGTLSIPSSGQMTVTLEFNVVN